MGIRSTQKLVEALRSAGASPSLVSRALAEEFHDFKSESATPTKDLVSAARREGLLGIAARAIAGEFDATPEESEEWANSAEGKEALNQVPQELRHLFEKPS